MYTPCNYTAGLQHSCEDECLQLSAKSPFPLSFFMRARGAASFASPQLCYSLYSGPHYYTNLSHLYCKKQRFILLSFLFSYRSVNLKWLGAFYNISWIFNNIFFISVSLLIYAYGISLSLILHHHEIMTCITSNVGILF